ncbi:MAG: single-stranded DNA-binding protein [Roseiarcus sp.]|jgi:single-strand DNA-binding protein
MSGSVNKVILVGNLGRDPEVRRLNSGDQVVNFTLATSENWRDKTTGERREKTEWHRVVIFNEGIGKIVEQYCKKGSKVYVEGQLQTRKWTDQSGAEKYTTEIVLQRFRGELTLLDSRAGASSGENFSGGEERAPSAPSFGRSSPVDRQPALASGGGGGGDIDDDIPF